MNTEAFVRWKLDTIYMVTRTVSSNVFLDEGLGAEHLQTKNGLCYYIIFFYFHMKEIFQAILKYLN